MNSHSLLSLLRESFKVMYTTKFVLLLLCGLVCYGEKNRKVGKVEQNIQRRHTDDKDTQICRQCENVSSRGVHVCWDCISVGEKAECQKNNTNARFTAFTAQLTTPKTILKNGIILFDKVIINFNNAYQPSDGKFRAPYKGVYQFSFSILSSENKYTHPFLVKNGAAIVQTFTGHSNGSGWASSGSATAILQLQAKDEVYIREANSNGGTYYGPYCSFTGVMLHAL